MKKNFKRLTDLTTCFVKYLTAFIGTSFLVNFMALVFHGLETLQILINICTTIMIFRIPKVRNRILINKHSWMTSSLQMRKHVIGYYEVFFSEAESDQLQRTFTDLEDVWKKSLLETRNKKQQLNYA